MKSDGQLEVALSSTEASNCQALHQNLFLYTDETYTKQTEGQHIHMLDEPEGNKVNEHFPQ